MRWILLSLFYRRAHWGPEKLYTFLKGHRASEAGTWWVESGFDAREVSPVSF